MEVPSMLLNRLLQETAKKAISLHLVVGSIPTMRIGKQLIEVEGEGLIDAETLLKIIDSFITPEEKIELQEKKEIVLAKTFAGSFRFRVNIYYQKSLPSVTFYYITNQIKSLSELKAAPILSGLSEARPGLFIITGPYASGKTTTAAAIIEEINKNQKKHIITIENPIEFSLVAKKSLVQQRQVGKDTKSYIDALSYCLEEDADVVYVGEIKDEFWQAVPYILEIANGNSLIIMEVNANNAIHAIEKVLNAAKEKMPAEAARYSLADDLIGVVAQKLLPRRGGGLILASEVLLANAAVKSLIREDKVFQLDGAIQTSRKDGMINMEKAMEELVQLGEVRREDIN